MRPKAYTALTPLVCVLLFTSTLVGTAAAKPTRTVTHEPARRLIVATPSSHPHPGRRTASSPVATRAEKRQLAKSTGKTTHAAKTTRATARAQSSATAARPAKQLSASSRIPHRADAGYPPVDAATLDRVHAWELTHRNPAPTTPVADPSQSNVDFAGSSTSQPSDDDPASQPGNSKSLALQPLNLDPSSLLRTSPELPRIRSIEEEALTPVLLPSLYDARGQLVVPAPLYGSHDVLLHQNQMADHDGLGRVHNDADLLNLRRTKNLVPLPITEALRVDERLPANRRFSRPWTAQFLSVLARDFYTSFHEPLQVNSAVRTVQFQKRLLRTNGNAAPAAGDTASPHLTGQAIDIGKRGFTLTELAWMRNYLQPLIEQGKIDVEEEFQQSCFHISVYRSYLPPAPAHVTVATASRMPKPSPTY